MKYNYTCISQIESFPTVTWLIYHIFDIILIIGLWGNWNRVIVIDFNDFFFKESKVICNRRDLHVISVTMTTLSITFDYSSHKYFVIHKLYKKCSFQQLLLIL